MIDKNTSENPLDLLRYTQTIIDRILFVSVIKDFGLIEAQVFVKLKQTAAESWLNDNGELWRQIKGFFIALDKGSSRIHRFNGGLFKQNNAINVLQIEDGALKNLLKISEYDFQSDLNINILGHIFEQSITDIERLKQKLTTNSEKEEKGKRKKEGIFYTPENITKHIIKQTLGKWLADKKEVLNLNRDSEENNIKDSKEAQISRWLDYKTILNTVKIIDPACGSGAFLTQTFDYLLSEWLIVLDVLEKLDYNDTETLSQVKKNIVSNNLFGVDINPESIEITKLGLWLKSASKNDALALLDTNIKCGNSLIGDPNATENAFDWHMAFPAIFTKEHLGFDIIVGNPPYVFTRELISDAEKLYFKANYQNTQFKINTYILFVEKSYQILHKNGYFGFIIPNNWLSLDKNSDFRQFILEKTANITIINMIDKIFEAASVDTSILFFQKQGEKEVNLVEFAQNTFRNKNTVQSAVFLQNPGYIIQLDSDEHTKKLCEKIQAQGVPLSEICKVNNGVQAYTVGEGNPKQTAEIRDKRLYHSTLQQNENWIKYVDGEDVQRYFMGWSGQYILYGNNLSRARRIELFQNPRILVRQIPAPAPYSIVANSTDLFFINDNNSMIISEPLSNNGVCFRLNYILAVLNSRLMSYWFTKTFAKMERKIFPQFKINELSQFPIAAATDEIQQNIEILVQDLQAQMVVFNQKNKDFQVILQASFQDLKINNALKSIYALDFPAFIKQIEQQKIKVTLKQKNEWLPYFETYKTKINAVLSDINAQNRQIDALIYGVYALEQDDISRIEIA